MKIRWLPEKPRRLLFLAAVLYLVVAGEWFYRRWHPLMDITTEHYLIHSSATLEQTREIGEVMESLQTAYLGVFGRFPGVAHPREKLQLRLFRDRDEFRRCNRGLGWAEAFYKYPYCNAFYSAGEVNHYHWMTHEAVHQLNAEVAHFKIPQWLDEGLSEYFGCSQWRKGVFKVGQVDRNTYPIWWLEEMPLSGELTRDLKDGEVIPLRAVVTGHGGPRMNKYFNLYYIHWWSLCHFLMESSEGKYREGLFRVIQDGGTLESFERNIGPIDRIQEAWYAYLMEQRNALNRMPPVRKDRN
jgi:hypothetical protein